MGKNFKKYWTISKVGWQEALEYRLDFFFNILRTSAIPFLMIFFWLAIYKDKSQIAGFDFSSMVTYYLGVMLLYSNNTGWVSHLISKEIKDGIITNNLLKPISYFKLMFFNFSPPELFMFLLRLLVCFIIFLVFPFKPLSLTPFNIFLFLIFLCLGYILNFILNILLSLTAFVLVENFMLRLSFLFLMRFFNGYMFPLSFFPPVLQKIINFSPFAYQFHFPIMILLGKLDWSKIFLGTIVLFILFFCLDYLIKFLWRKGLRHYEAVGR